MMRFCDDESIPGSCVSGDGEGDTSAHLSLVTSTPVRTHILWTSPHSRLGNIMPDLMY